MSYRYPAGFYNPAKTMRIFSSSISFVSECKKLMAKILTEGSPYFDSIRPAPVSQQNNRGKKEFNLKPKQEFRSPYNYNIIFHIPEESEEIICFSLK